jgi:hypothetical protein
VNGRPSFVRRAAQSLLGPVMAVLVSLIISGIVIALIGEDPLTALQVMVDLGDTPAQQTQSMVVILNRAIPLFLAGLAVSIAFRMGSRSGWACSTSGSRVSTGWRPSWRRPPARRSCCLPRCTCCWSSSWRCSWVRYGPASWPC